MGNAPFYFEWFMSCFKNKVTINKEKKYVRLSWIFKSFIEMAEKQDSDRVYSKKLLKNLGD